MLSKLAASSQKFITDNATTLLTAVGVTGSISTGVLGYRAGYKSATTLVETRINDALTNDEHLGKPFPEAYNDAEAKATKSDDFKLIWPELIPPIGACTVTVASILFSHKMNAGRAATLAAAYSMSESKYREYRDRINQAKTPEEMAEVNKDFDASQASKPAQPQFIFMTGDVLFLDGLTGHYFQSTMHAVEQAVGTVNHEIMTHGHASLGMFYDEIGVGSSDLTEGMGWNTDHTVDVTFGSEITPDGKPCIVLTFLTIPIHDYK